VLVVAEERESIFYWAGVPAVVQRWKKTVDKDGDLKNNHVLGSTVVNFLKYSYT